MEKWKTDGRPLVSVVCVTYNHERYIRDAIEGFLMQKTDFPFEIIIHDDASTDATPEIIAEYAGAYPEIVRPVFQSVNQHSRDRNCFLIASSHAKGEYIALCEGDDYWTDPEKLQIQISAMRNHPHCGISFHSAVMNYGEGTTRELFCRHASRNRVYTTRYIILRGGAFMPSSSICLRRQSMAVMLEPRDNFFSTFLYDYFLQVFGSLNGGALYINKEMSVYRYMSSGSWTELMTSDGDYFLNWMRTNISAIKQVDAMTGNRYSAEFCSIIRKRHGAILRSCLLPQNVRRRHFERERREAGLVNVLLWHAAYRHDAINAFLAEKLPLLRKLRSTIQNLRRAL